MSHHDWAQAAKHSGKSRHKPAQATAASHSTYAHRPEAMALADAIASRQGLDPAWVRQVIAQARQLPQVSRLAAPPPAGTPKNWAAYRARFIEPRRIQAGVAFWQTHRKALARAESVYGVPASLIVGIIGVETLYGQHMGSYRVIDALTTLAFDFPANHPRAQERSRFFQGELEQLLSLKHQNGVDPTQLRGSYAGAMGLPQFMPSSWARFAVDFDGDGRIDLFRSASDAIGSVANYLHAFGWQTDMPTHFEVTFDAATLDKEALLAPDILPTFTVAQFMAKGALPEAQGQQHTGKLALVEVFNGDAPPSYVAGTENFYVVTRYNWSSYYALAVIGLGQAVKEQMGR